LDNVAGWILELIEEKVFPGKETTFLVKKSSVWHWKKSSF
jgi:hypothetical protein